MPKLTIDNREVEIEAGATILDAARKVGIAIPTMCFLEGCTPATSCMVCVVKVRGLSRLVPACGARAQEGMAVETHSPEVRAARRTALELLFGDHLGDCVGPCHSACPAHMDIPKMIRQVAAGQYRDAIVTVKEHIALPAVLGRICPEVCEKACRRSARDSAVSICLLKRFVADVDLASGQPYLPERKPASGKRVAIVGAGPAGLAAAFYLLQAGHGCVIFDDHADPGGMLRYGVPETELPRGVLDAEIGIIEQLGAEFRLGVRVGENPSISEIKAEFDAVIIAAGQMDQEALNRLGLQLSEHGVHVDRATMMTGTDGVFAAGSAVAPSHLAVRAVAGGRSAAVAVDHFLAGEKPLAALKPYSVHIGRLVEGEISVFMDGVSEAGRVEPAGDGFTDNEARAECARCLHCECGKLVGCRLRDLGIEYHAVPAKYRGNRQHAAREATHPHLIYESGKCISCGLCVQIAEQTGEPLGLTFLGRGFNVRPAAPFSEPLSKALKLAAERCAESCPTGALVWVEGSTLKLP